MTTTDESVLVLEPVTGMVVCRKCGQGLTLKRGMEQHLKGKHGMEPEMVKVMCEAARAKARKAKETVHGMRGVYLTAPHVGTASGVATVLKALPFFAVHDAFPCPKCPKFFTTAKSFGKHGETEHCMSKEDIEAHGLNAGKVKVQTLMEGSKRQYFPVQLGGGGSECGDRTGCRMSRMGEEVKNGFVMMDEDDVDDVSGEMGQGCGGEKRGDGHFDMKRGGTKETEGRERAGTMDVAVTEGGKGSGTGVDVKMCTPESNDMSSALDALFHCEKTVGKVNVGVGGELANDFIAKFRPEELMEEENVSLPEAYRLCEAPRVGDETEKMVKEDSLFFMEEVDMNCGKLAPSVVKSVTLRPDGQYPRVTRKTREKYALFLCSVVCCAKRMVECGCKRGELVSVEMTKYMELAELVARGDTDAEWCGKTGITELLSARRGLFHVIARKVLLQTIPIYVRTDQLFIRFYLTFKSVMCGDNETYRFCEAEEMSPTLAALQFCCSGVALNTIGGIGDCCEGEERRAEMEEEVMGIVKKALSMERNNAASYIRNLLNLCMSLLMGHTADVRYMDCNDHANCAHIDGVELSMETLGKCMKGWQRKAESLMTDKILFGYNVTVDMVGLLRGMEDKMGRKEAGFMFLKLERNRAARTSLLEGVKAHLSGSFSAKALLGPVDDDEREKGPIGKLGTVDLFRNGVERWLKLCEEVQMYLLSLMHVSGGSPARATEICTLNVQNSSTATRNVFVSQREVVFISRYSKSRCIRGGDKHLGRFMDSTTSKLFLMYLTMIRPIEVVFIQFLTGDENLWKEHMLSMFCERGVQMRDDRVRTVVTSLLEEQGIRLTFQQLRHFMTGMAKTIGSRENMDLQLVAEEVEETAHELAGHSASSVQRAYARSWEEHTSISTNSLARFRNWCFIWHRHLGLMEGAAKSGTTGCKRTEVSNDGGGDAKKWKYGNAVGEEAMEMLSEHISNRVSQSLRGSLTGDGGSGSGRKHMSPTPVSWNGLESPTPAMSPLQVRTPHSDGGRGNNSSWSREEAVVLIRPCFRSADGNGRSMLPELRKMLRNPSALFKSQMQCEVCAFLTQRLGDALVVMPTGSGKTLCYLLPAFIEGEDHCTVVFLPLVALRRQIAAICEEYGLSVREWWNRDPGRYGHGQVYLFAAEHLELVQCIRFMHMLSTTGRLKRIVVDEVHLTVQWADFRPSMANMRFALKSLKCHVPRVLLSATVPPFEARSVLEMHGVHYAALFRMPTVRRNLRLTVSTVQIGRFSSMTKALIGELCTVMDDICARHGRNNPNGFRIIVYVQQSKFISDIAEGIVTGNNDGRLDVVMYCGSMSEERKQHMHGKWISPLGRKVRVMVCTKAFGTGIDSENVRAVIHFGGSDSLVEYAQEVGRAGRDGKAADGVVIFMKNYAKFIMNILTTGVRKPSEDDNDDTAMKRARCSNFAEFQGWVENTSDCRKNALYETIDGESCGLCVFNELSINCDVCEKMNGADLDGPVEIVVEHNGVDGQCKEEMEEMSQVGMERDEQGDIHRWRTIPSVRRTLDYHSSNTLEVAPPTKTLDGIVDMEISKVGEDADMFITAVKEVSRALRSVCIVCTVRAGSIRIHQKCAYKRLCGSCYSSQHLRNVCTLKVFYEQKCYMCGIGKVRGIDIHDANFGKRTCEFPNIGGICYQLWYQRVEEDEVLKQLMTETEQGTLLLRPRSLRPGKVREFTSWLNKETDGIPTRLRVAMVWAARNQIVSISNAAMAILT